MAKLKSEKSGKGVPQKHLHARVSYLHQVAQYLSTKSNGGAGKGTTRPSASKTTEQIATNASSPPIALGSHIPQSHSRSQSQYILSQLRAVSLKSQIRLSPALKHSICKRCDTLLIAGSTCSQTIVNESPGGRKPWADVLVVSCVWCGAAKTFAVGQNRGEKERCIQRSDRPVQ